MLNLIIIQLLLFTSAVAAQEFEELRDVKPPVDLPTPFFIVILMLIAAVAVFIVYFLWKNFLKKKKEAQLPEKTLLPWEAALKQLEELEKKGLIVRGMFKEYYFELSLILRRYFEGRFSVKAPEMTTEEFLFSLKTSAFLTDKQKSLLESFFYFSDMVKFAKLTPSAVDAKSAYTLVIDLVNETKNEATSRIG